MPPYFLQLRRFERAEGKGGGVHAAHPQRKGPSSQSAIAGGALSSVARSGALARPSLRFAAFSFIINAINFKHYQLSPIDFNCAWALLLPARAWRLSASLFGRDVAGASCLGGGAGCCLTVFCRWRCAPNCPVALGS